MPAPDITRPRRVESKAAFVSPANTSATTVISAVPANSNVRVRTVLVTNRTGTAQVFTLSLTRTGQSLTAASSLFAGVTVPANSTFLALGSSNPIYMEAGDALSFTAGAANSLNLHVSYEAIT